MTTFSEVSQRIGNFRPAPGDQSQFSPCAERNVYPRLCALEPKMAHNWHTAAAEIGLNQRFEEVKVMGEVCVLSLSRITVGDSPSDNQSASSLAPE